MDATDCELQQFQPAKSASINGVHHQSIDSRTIAMNGNQTVMKFALLDEEEKILLLHGDKNALMLLHDLLGDLKQGSISTPDWIIGRQFGKLTFVASSAESVRWSQGKDFHWKMDSKRIEEVMMKLEILYTAHHPCHHYIDIEEFDFTIKLSMDEYFGSAVLHW